MKLCVDRRVCDKYKMLCDDVYTDGNQEVKNFLDENCPNTCGYCSKFILNITNRLTQMNGGVFDVVVIV